VRALSLNTMSRCKSGGSGTLWKPFERVSTAGLPLVPVPTIGQFSLLFSEDANRIPRPKKRKPTPPPGHRSAGREQRISFG
jgi:hypothetical protein